MRHLLSLLFLAAGAAFGVDADSVGLGPKPATAGDVTIAGDVTGLGSATTVAKVNGVALGSTTATAGNLLIGSGSTWVTQALTGDLTLSSAGVVAVTKVNGKTVPYIIAHDATGGWAVTGTVSSTLLRTVAIPANAIAVGGMIKVTSLWSRNTSGTSSTSAQIRDATTIIGSGASITTASTTLQKEYCLWLRSGSTWILNQESNSSTYLASAATVVTFTQDPAVGWNLNFYGVLGNTGDTETLEAYTVEAYP